MINHRNPFRRIVTVLAVMLFMTFAAVAQQPQAEYVAKGRYTRYRGVISVPLQDAFNVPSSTGSIGVGIQSFVRGNTIKFAHSPKQVELIQIGFQFIGYTEANDRPPLTGTHQAYVLIDGKSYLIQRLNYDVSYKHIKGFMKPLFYTVETLTAPIDLPLLARMSYGQRVDFRINNIEFEVLPEQRQQWKNLYHKLTG